MKKEMQKQEGASALTKLQKKHSRKIIISVIIVIALLGIIIFSGFSLYFYFKSPEKTLGIGANIESALVSPDNQDVYVKLLGGSDKNITKIKFIFTDFLGEEHYYETTEGAVEISVAFERSFWDWLFGKPKFKGKYEYRINAEDVGLFNFEDIEEVSVLFEYETETGEVVETEVLDTGQTTTLTSGRGPSGNGDDGGGTCTTGSWTNIEEYRCNKTIRERKQIRSICPSGTEEQWIIEDCEEGGYCYDGEGAPADKCINETKICVDSDEKNYYNKGNVTLDLLSFVFDECSITDDNVTEYYCYFNGTEFEIRNESFNCSGGCLGGACERPECTEDSNCSELNLEEIATCDNIPDDNSFTWDYAPANLSECIDKKCTIPMQTLIHNCNVSCNAECDATTTCSPTSCGEDACEDREGDGKLNDFVNYTDSINNCKTDCTCENNVCLLPTITYNDSVNCPATQCNDCGFWGFGCNINDCHDLGNCYYDPSPIPFVDDCVNLSIACSAIDICSEYTDEECQYGDRCNVGCNWNESLGSCEEVVVSKNITIGSNNELIVNNEKFFPIFVWDQRISGLDYLKSLGVNSIVGYDGGDGDVINWLDAGAAREMYMIPSDSHLYSSSAGQSVLENHPALIAALVAHEPDSGGESNPDETPVEVQVAEDNFKSKYPEILTINLLTASFYTPYRQGSYSWYSQYMALGDIMSYDHYPVTGWNKPDRVYQLGEATNEAYVDYLFKGKPIWPIIEASDQDLSWTAPETRGPYNYEMRAEAWLSIVNGAKALGYFTIAFNPFSYNRLTPEIETEMNRTNNQIIALKDIILEADPADVSVSATATNGLTVQTMIRKYNNKVYIFAVEGDSGYCPQRSYACGETDRQNGVATFTLTGVPDNSVVNVYDEPRTIQAVGNSFTDNFKELDVHIYEISLTPALKSNNLTRYNITWTFDKEYEYGTFANGDYWVVPENPGENVTITRITVVDEFGQTVNASREIGGRTMHGSQINPDPNDNPPQGYDSHYYRNPPQYFDPNLNVARPNGNDLDESNPLIVPVNSSLISSISNSTPLVRPQLLTAAILTVLSEAPPIGSFRPAYTGNDKTIKFNKADLNNAYSLLGNLSRTGLGAPSLSDVERYFERPWLDHAGYEEISRYHHPQFNMPNFGRDMAKQIGIGALMLNLDFTPEEKENLLVRMTQLGIDFYGIVENDNGNDIWTCAGGHSSGRKWPILFAGLVLDNPNAAEMKNIGEKSGDYMNDAQGNLKDPQPSDYINFGEDDQTFYVVQSDIDRYHNLNEDGDLYLGYSYPYLSDYFPGENYLGMPEWGIDHGDMRGSNNGPRRDNVRWATGYRWNQNGAAWLGYILAGQIMEETASAKTLWNHDVLFDYEDRFMAIQKDNNWACGDYRISWSCFVETMWDTYRSQYGCVWTRDINSPGCVDPWNQASCDSQGHYNCFGQNVTCAHGIGGNTCTTGNCDVVSQCSDYTNNRSCNYDPCNLDCGGVCGPAQPCNLTSAYWNTTNVIEGTQVQLIASGTDCSGKQLNFTIYEDDLIFDNIATSIVSSYDRATWTATYEFDWGTPNEYYFTVFPIEYSSNIITSSAPMLSVNQAPATQCNNGIDDDSDNAIDLADFGCENLADNDEINNGLTQCSNGVDDDLDTFIDQDDSDCSSFQDNSEEPSVLPEGLVSYWKFDDDFSDGITDDETGNNDGTIIGVTQVGDATRNLVASFDGNDLINVGDMLSSGSDEITLAAWVFHADTGDDRVICKSTGTAVSNHIFCLGIAGITARVRLNTGTATSHDGTISVNTNEWAHVAFTYDGSNIRIYVNGQEAGVHSKTGSITASNQEVVIGNINLNDDRYFNGKIDEVMIFNRSLSAEEIQQIMNLGIECSDINDCDNNLVCKTLIACDPNQTGNYDYYDVKGCGYNFNNGVACNDNLYCTENTVCNLGICGGGTDRNCADAVACTDDSCNEITDSCNNIINNSKCTNPLLPICDVNLGCIANPCYGINNCEDYLDSANCTTDFCDVPGICEWNATTLQCEEIIMPSDCTIYVAASGTSGTGNSPDDPIVATGNAVLNVGSAGDVVCLKSGNYGEVSFDSGTAVGNAGAWITYKSASGEEPIIEELYLNDVGDSYLVFDGLHFQAPNRAHSRVVQIEGSSRHIKILNCEAEDREGWLDVNTNAIIQTTNDGLEIPQDIIVDNCDVHTGRKGIGGDAGNFIITNNHVHYISDSGIKVGGNGPVLIGNNHIYNQDVTLRTSDPHGTGISVRSINTIIRNNTIHNYGNSIVGINFYNDPVGGWPSATGYINILVENNLIYDPLYGKTEVAFETGTIGNNFTFRNNTIIGYREIGSNYGYRFRSGVLVGLDTEPPTPFHSTYTNGEFKFHNNIIVGHLAFFNGQTDFDRISEGNNIIWALLKKGEPFYTEFSPTSTSKVLAYGSTIGGYMIHGDSVDYFEGSGNFFLGGANFDDYSYTLPGGNSHGVNLNDAYYPMITSDACNGSVNPRGVAVGALPCVCTETSQCEQVFGSGYVCENGKCIESVSIQKTNNISQFGITWTFSEPVQYGQFANGDYWVVPENPGENVTIIGIDPLSVSGSREKNGAMVNPDPSYPLSTGNQGYDSAMLDCCEPPKTVYNSDLNKALNVSASNPLKLSGGNSLVSTISWDTPKGVGPVQILRTAAILTVLNSAPPEGSFRPAYSGPAGKTVLFNKNTAINNMHLLKSLDTTGIPVPTLKQTDPNEQLLDYSNRGNSVERMFERPWLMHIPGWSNYAHPTENLFEDGKDIADAISMAALMLHLNFTNPEKEILLIRYMQLGIDLYGIANNTIMRHWDNNGQINQGRKWPILFAGIMLDDSVSGNSDDNMRAIGEKTGDYLYNGSYGAGNPPPDYFHFQEDDQTFYIDDEAVNRVYTPTCGGYTTQHLGWPEWGIQHSTSPFGDALDWSSYLPACANGPAYRHNNAAVWPGFILAALMMEETASAKTLWNHDSLFDYEDRFVAIWKYISGQGLLDGITIDFPGVSTAPDSWKNYGGFYGSVWDRYRADYGCIYMEPDPPGTENRRYSCLGEIFDCGLVNQCSDYTNQRACSYDPCNINCSWDGSQCVSGDGGAGSMSPFTRLWNFLKGLLTRETGQAILTGKITGNAVGEGKENSKTIYALLSLFVVVILIIVVITMKIKKTRKKSKKNSGKRKR